ncbi:hypothetical protein Hypma_002126 [Hypsizygus marmoreus]|uniref:Uncharacterized protein n=1 Tax=Hypsizygus marmoreus TaxID=39966 RepID=A0A369K3C2_HYPMA|nr:hypothetical protein Hypma_002126 [Hypsizygus marmoreus]
MSTSKTTSSPALADFDHALARLLDEGHTHASLKTHMRDFILERSKGLPPVKVLYNCNYGGFSLDVEMVRYLVSISSLGISPEDETYYAPPRADPAIIDAITEYGRLASLELPFVADVMRVSRALGLEKAFMWGKLNKDWETAKVVAWPDLVRLARAFLDSKAKFATAGCPGHFRDFAKKNPDTWHSFPGFTDAERRAFMFTQTLLRDNHDEYYMPPDPVADRGIYEAIGVACAGSSIRLHIVPAGLEYTITEYDGLEGVRY